MVTLLVISAIAAILVLVPRTVYATKGREVCPACRYSLDGLPDEGVCPECGSVYAEKVIARVGSMFRWAVVPRVVAAMVVPAVGPFISTFVLAWIMRWRYGWAWSAAWFQSSERELKIAVLFTVPFLINGWLLMGVQAEGPVTDGIKLRGVDGRGFWMSLVLSTLAGSIAMTSVGAVAWINRVYFDAGFLYFVAMFIVLAAMGGGHLVARQLERGDAHG